MNELIQSVCQKTDLPETQARAAVDTVISYLKGRLPAPIAGQIDNALAGGGTSGAMGDISKGLGGVFGNT